MKMRQFAVHSARAARLPGAADTWENAPAWALRLSACNAHAGAGKYWASFNATLRRGCLTRHRPLGGGASGSEAG